MPIEKALHDIFAHNEPVRIERGNPIRGRHLRLDLLSERLVVVVEKSDKFRVGCSYTHIPRDIGVQRTTRPEHDCESV